LAVVVFVAIGARLTSTPTPLHQSITFISRATALGFTPPRDAPRCTSPAMREREARRAHVDRQLSGLSAAAARPALDVKAIRADLGTRVEKWGAPHVRIAGDATFSVVIGGLLSKGVASPEGFEPSISALKGPRVGPLHHGDPL
jgi:hypothetical protein